MFSTYPRIAVKRKLYKKHSRTCSWCISPAVYEIQVKTNFTARFTTVFACLHHSYEDNVLRRFTNGK